MSALDQLKDGVAATLESTGVLARIRAELRAEVFAAIEMQKPAGPSIPQKIDEFARNDFGKQTIDLIVEFLQFFGLKHTLSVFRAETHRPDTTTNRDSLWNAISLSTASEFSLRKPLLVSLLEQRKQSTFALDGSRMERDPFPEGRTTSGVSHRISLPNVQVIVPSESNAPKATTVSPSESRDVHETEARDIREPEVRGVHVPNPRNVLLADAKEPEFRGVSDSEPKGAVPSESGKILEPKSSSVRRQEPSSIPGLGPESELVNRPSPSPKAASLATISALPNLNGPKRGDPMTDQLHQIDDLLKQLDTKQKLTDEAKAQFRDDSHLPLEEFSDNDDVEFDDDDFEYEPDDVVKEDPDELFPGFSSKPPPARPVVSNQVECFSDDPSADEDALDSFDVVHDVTLLSQRAM